MARRSMPTFTELWKKHEAMYIEIFSEALTKLALCRNIHNEENYISALLCVLLTETCCEYAHKNEKEVPVPIWEGPIPPKDEAEVRNSKGRSSRPDFTCNCINRMATSEDYLVPFHVECKRLGKRERNWVLNRNYVLHGIYRFDSRKHGYGKRAMSGLMIGYIINMEPDEIVKEINSYQSKSLPNNDSLVIATNANGTFEARQNFQRKSVLPSDFRLLHIWVDLRRTMEVA